MADYIHPGVYISEYDKTNYVGQGSSTSTGIVGTASKGESNTIKFISTYDDYKLEYGQDGGYLDHSARYFFKNGGNKLRVVRVTDNFRYAGLGVVCGAKSMMNTPGPTIYNKTGELVETADGIRTGYVSILDEVPTIVDGTLNLYWEGRDLGTLTITDFTITETWAYAGVNVDLVLIDTGLAGFAGEDLTSGTVTINIDGAGNGDTTTTTDIVNLINGNSVMLSASGGTVAVGNVAGTHTCVGGNNAAARTALGVDAGGVLGMSDELTGGTINYTNGTLTLVFNNPPNNGTLIEVDYDQSYTGLRKEDTTLTVSTVSADVDGLALADYPDSGIIKIEDELIRYGEMNATTGTFSQLTRGIKSTSAVHHYTDKTKVKLVSEIVSGKIDASSFGTDVSIGTTNLPFKNLKDGMLTDSGTIYVINGTATAYSYSSILYTDTDKTEGYIVLDSVTTALIPNDSHLFLDVERYGEFGDSSYEKYMEFDKWGEPNYDNSGALVNAGGVEDPSENYLFFNIISAYPGTLANTEIRVSLYNKTDWNDSTNIPYYKNKVDKFPITNDELLIIIENALTNEVLESYNVSLLFTSKDEFGKSKWIIDVINQYSSYIKIFLNSSFMSQTKENFDDGTAILPKSFERLYLGGGTDGDNDGFVDDGTVITGYDLFRNKMDVEIDLISAGGFTSIPIQNNIISICESRRDCFGILSIPFGLDVDEAVSFKESLTSSSFSAIYFNTFQYLDPITNTLIWLPPAVQVGSIFIKNDTIAKPWNAPAGYERAAMTEVVKLENILSEGDMDVLYMNSINPIVNESAGPVVWGNKTLQFGASAFQKINIRRLMLVIEKDISKSLKPYMFKQNTSSLRTQIKMMITPYLENVIAGDGIKEALVVCDSSNNTDETELQGKVIVDIYIKPIYATEYIIANFTVTKDLISSVVNA